MNANKMTLSCFDAHTQLNKTCQKKSCRYWMNSSCNKNCTIVAAKDGPMTLQQVGEIFGITRMRICQLEKRIMKAIRETRLSEES